MSKEQEVQDQDKELTAKDVNLENIIQVLNVYNQAVGIGNSKQIYTEDDAELIAKAKRFSNAYATKEKLKLNFNNSFFVQTTKENEQGQKVYNFEPITLEPTKTSKKSVKVFEIKEDVLLFTNDQIFQAREGDTVLEYKGNLFFEPIKREEKEEE
jgi:hypothetical protein